MAYERAHYQVSAFHDGQLTNDRELDDRDAQNDKEHHHFFQTWEGNKMVLICKCGQWHYKE